MSLTLMSYYAFDYWDVIGDGRNVHYPLMSGGPWRILIIVSLYLLFATKIGPKLMKNRKPFQLKKAMIFYNISMVLINVLFFAETLISLNYGNDLLDFQCPSKTDMSPKTKRKLFTGYLYILTKLLDLTDTVFIVLRKKDKHLTRLHLYHHSAMPVLGWLAVRLSPTSGPIGIFPLINSLVHTIMYSYYALSALGPQIRKYLWWKQYITLIQLIQFLIYLIYSIIFVIFQTGYQAQLFYVCGLPQPIIFFLLFKQFYNQTYKSNKVKFS